MEVEREGGIRVSAQSSHIPTAAMILTYSLKIPGRNQNCGLLQQLGVVVVAVVVSCLGSTVCCGQDEPGMWSSI